ncbi:MAG TPA: hypothetical protein VK837_01850 [Longimicrobiales bacterium]|nr:hypothetical protein [Longimicrobiales bacterium]
MRPDRLPRALAAVSVTLVAAIAWWGFSVDPEPPRRWMFLGGFLPALWAFVERGQVRGKDAEVGAAIMAFHYYTFAFIGFMLASRVGVRLMVHEQLVDPVWLASGRRFGGLALGVGMILFGNYLPTLRSPWPFEAQPFAWQRVHRFVGWTSVLGGLGVLGAWIVLPQDLAGRTTVQIVAIVALLALGRKLASLTARTAEHR